MTTAGSPVTEYDPQDAGLAIFEGNEVSASTMRRYWAPPLMVLAAVLLGALVAAGVVSVVLGGQYLFATPIGT